MILFFQLLPEAEKQNLVNPVDPVKALGRMWARVFM
jgi:hypothetical protein